MGLTTIFLLSTLSRLDLRLSQSPRLQVTLGVGEVNEQHRVVRMPVVRDLGLSL